MAKFYRVAYTVRENPKHNPRKPSGKENPKNYWTRIGVSFRNEDGSETIRLNALPIDGTLILRYPKEELPPQDGSSADEDDINDLLR